MKLLLLFIPSNYSTLLLNNFFKLLYWTMPQALIKPDFCVLLAAVIVTSFLGVHP